MPRGEEYCPNAGFIHDSFFPKNYDDDKLQKIRVKYPIPRNTWIVKPGENSNRGIGISVASEYSEIKNLVNSSAMRE